MGKTLILMSDNRMPTGDIFYTNASIINYNYAMKHGYDFKYFIPSECYSLIDNKRHPAWGKILSVLKAFKYFDYDRIVYVDTDCIFEDQEQSIDDYLKNAKNLNGKSIKKNIPIYFLNDYPDHPGDPCSGFFVANKDSIPMLNHWYQLESEFNDTHPWEQGALVKYVYPVWKDQIEIIDDIMFHRKSHPQFLVHLTGTSDKNRAIRNGIFKEFIKTNEIKYTEKDLEIIDFRYKLV